MKSILPAGIVLICGKRDLGCDVDVGDVIVLPGADERVSRPSGGLDVVEEGPEYQVVQRLYPFGPDGLVLSGRCCHRSTGSPPRHRATSR
jgi:hypothetical protein